MLKPIHKFFVGISVIGLFSCEGDITLQYHFSGLDAQHAQNTGEKPEPSTNDSIAKETYVLRLNLFPVETERRGRYMDPETPPRNTNPISYINITSDADFSTTLPAGSSINQVFLIYNGNYLATSSLGELAINQVYTEDFYDDPVPDYIDLLMMIPPDSGQYYRFFIEVRLSDGTTFNDSTTAVKIY